MFEYHGAEHKTISCYEAEDELTPARARLYSRLHPRCGTSFLLIVMVLAIFVFAPIGLPAWYWLIVSRILGIPLIAGLSYEVIKWAGKNRRKRWVRGIMWPGLMLQNLTTREPETEQLAVAIASLEAVLARERSRGRRRSAKSRSSRDRSAGRADRGTVRRAGGPDDATQRVIGDRERYAALARQYRELQPAHELALEYRKLGDDLEGARELLAEGEDTELRKVLEQAPERARGAGGGDQAGDGRARPERLTRTCWWRSGLVPAATRRRCSPATCSRCYPLRRAAGVPRPRCSRRSAAEAGGFKEVTFAVKGDGCLLGLQVRGRAPTASSGCPRPSPRAASTPRPRRSRCCRRPRTSRSRSTPTICRSTSTAPRARAASRSTRPTPRCGSPTCRPGSSSRCRTRSPSSRTRSAAMRVLRARLYERELAEQQAKIAAERRARSAAASAPRRSAPTTSRRTGSPTTASSCTSHNLDGVLGGELGEFTDALAAEEKRRRLQAAAAAV